MNTQKQDEIRKVVREAYGEIAKGNTMGCGCSSSSCCGISQTPGPAEYSRHIGYSPEEIDSVPQGADLGLGCGNPQAIAALNPGEVVLDLGSGGGFDCFLAAGAVGDQGYVIGVDMTPEMVHKARRNAEKVGLKNVEFRLGEIEYLPVPDATIDVIISNCVINLSTDKAQVFREAFRVLQPGGRLAIADMVAKEPLPESLRQDTILYTGCIGGAATMDALNALLTESGFTDIRITTRFELKNTPVFSVMDEEVANRIVSATIEASKPEHSK
jgi:SAM-dependent methyltransferase